MAIDTNGIALQSTSFNVKLIVTCAEEISKLVFPDTLRSNLPDME